MKSIKILTLFSFCLSLKPSFACACGDAPSMQSLIFMWGLLGLMSALYLVPTLYFALCFKKYQLSLWRVIVPHILTAAIFYLLRHSFQLGLHPMYAWLIHSVPQMLIFALIMLMATICWLYPAFYTYAKALDHKQRGLT